MARFVGFENVFDRAELAADAGSPFAAWLLARAGDEGVAFARPEVVRATGETAPAWEGRVQSARPTPEGLAVTLRVGGLSVALRLAPPWTGPLPSVGDRLRFAVDGTNVHPLGGPFPGRPEDP